ncbi:MAG: TolC family protein [Candidatus Muiribacteriota bacterium]
MKKIFKIVLLFISLTANSFSFEDCMEKASENKEIIQTRRMLEVSRLEIIEAEKKALPAVSIELQENVIDTRKALLTASPKKETEPTASLKMSLPVSTDGSLSSNILLRRKTHNINAMLYDFEYTTLKLSVLLKYIDVLKSFRQMEMSAEISNRADSLLNIYEELYKMNKITRLELLNARKESGKLKYEVFLSEKVFSDSYIYLLKEINGVYSELKNIKDVDVDMNFEIDITEASKHILDRRIEVQIYKAEKEVAEIAEKLAMPKNNFYLNFEYIRGGDYNTDRNEFYYPLSKEGHIFGLYFERPIGNHMIKYNREYEKIGRKPGGGYLEKTKLVNDKLTFQFFDNGTEKSLIETKKIEADFYRRKLDEYIKNIKLDLRAAYYNMQSARELIKVQQETVAYFDEKIEIEEEKYRLGKFSLPELLESHVDALREKQKYIEALYDYKSAFFNLKYQLGELNETI